MRTYNIEELDPEQISKVKRYLDREGYQSPLDDIYWFELPNRLLTQEQDNHSEYCGPYFLSVETGQTWLKLELLVRARKKFRCSCIAYATPEQRHFGIELLDQTLKNLDIPV
jgi:hypothetical protein